MSEADQDMDSDPARLIDAHIDGEISNDEVTQLEAWLCESNEHRREFVRLTHLHRQLRDMTCGTQAHVAISPIADVLETSTTERLATRRGWIVAGALGLCVAIAAWFAYPYIKAMQVDATLGTLVETRDCRWSSDSPVASEGDRLPVAVPLSLLTGTATIDLDNGSRLQLHGPTRLSIESDGTIKLPLGELSAAVSEQGVGLTVVTPSVTVVDLGTQFGLFVERKGITEVQVFQGKVDAQIAASRSLAAESHPLVANQAIRVDPQRGGVVAKGSIDEVALHDLRPVLTRDAVQSLAEYNFDEEFAATHAESFVKAESLRNGGGCRLQIDPNIGTASPSLELTGIEANDVDNAVKKKEYLEFTVRATQGRRLLLTGLGFDHQSGSRAQQWCVVRWNVDGYRSDLTLPILAHGNWEEVTHANGHITYRELENELDATRFQREVIRLPNRVCDRVTFRIYGFAQAGSESPSSIRFDNLIVQGSLLPAKK